MPRLCLAAVSALVLAGCTAAPGGTTSAPGSTSQDGEPAFIDGVTMFTTGMPTSYAVVGQPVAALTIVLKPLESVPAPKVFLRAVGQAGTVHDTILQPALAPGRAQGVEWSLEGVAFPAVVVAECACHVWVHDPDRQDDAVRPGPEGTVRQAWLNVTVGYEATRPEDVTGNPALHDEASFSFSPSVIHWQLWWAHNLQGEFRLFTPAGDELAYLKTEGRTVVEGHLSEGYTPLLGGAWRAELDGHGWFSLTLDTYAITPEGWQLAGVVPPS